MPNTTKEESIESLSSRLGSVQLAQIMEFRKKFLMPTPKYPVLLSRDRALHHHRLFVEELSTEFMEAVDKEDIVGIVDSLMDGLVVVLHAVCEYGLASWMTDFFTEVNNSNLSKLDGGAPIFDERGKFQKGPAYIPPRLQEMLLQLFRITNGNTEMARALLSISTGVKSSRDGLTHELTNSVAIDSLVRADVEIEEGDRIFIVEPNATFFTWDPIPFIKPADSEALVTDSTVSHGINWADLYSLLFHHESASEEHAAMIDGGR